MVATRTGYDPGDVSAARSVLLELAHLLGRYHDSMVLVGGWVPALLVPNGLSSHTGSLDVDTALDHRTFHAVGYATIALLLKSRGYMEGSQPYIFHRTVDVKGHAYKVQVDLLSGEYAGTSTSHRTQRVQDVQPRKARGCDMALDLYTEVVVEGELPGGGRDSAVIRVASIVPLLVMKAMALADRLKEKDAWDIYYCLVNYPGGVDAIAEEFRPHLQNRLVREGLEKIGGKFASPDHVGPKSVADFEELADPEDRALRQRDAYERVGYLLRQLELTQD